MHMKLIITTLFLFSCASSLKIQQAAQNTGCLVPFVKHGGDCTTENNCIMSPNYPNDYTLNSSCDFTVCSDPPVLDVIAFNTEAGFDYLYVDVNSVAVAYSGTTGPVGVTPDASGQISWTSDYSVPKSGWKICPGTTTTTTLPSECNGNALPPWVLESGSCTAGTGSTYGYEDRQYCIRSPNYNNGANEYSINGSCEFVICSAQTMEVVHFNTEQGFDYVYVNGNAYSGTIGPSNQIPSMGSTITWTSDYSVQKKGWEICASGYLTSNVVGDPHIRNVKGAKFDISKQGLADLIKIPSHNAKDLRMEAIFERTISWCCIGIYVTEVRLTGNWLRDDNTITVRSAQKNSLQPSVLLNHKEIWPFEGDLKRGSQVMIKALNYSDSAQGILVKLENNVALEIMRIREKPEFCDDVIPENLQQAYSFLNINVQGLGNSMIKSSVGGLLGTDDYSAWTGNHNCDVQESDRHVSGNISMTKGSPSNAKLNDFFASRVTVS